MKPKGEGEEVQMSLGTGTGGDGMLSIPREQRYAIYLGIQKQERNAVRASLLLFARHGHNLMGESPERAPIAGSA